MRGVSNKHCLLTFFIGIVQVLRFDFQKFKILEILNFHSCIQGSHRLEKYLNIHDCLESP